MINGKNINSFLLVFITFLTSFLLGFYISYKIDFSENTNNLDKKNIINNIIKDRLIDKDLNLNLFWQVYNVVSENYYGLDELVDKDLEYGIINGFVNSLGDKFSEFMTPEITKEFNGVLSGDFEGIGAVIDKHELGVIIDRVLKGSPAGKKGIFKGDIVIEANGNSLKGLSASESASFMKGPAGTKVILKIIRAGESDFITKEIIRDKIKIPSVDTLDLQDQELGYISLNMFGENTSSEFLEILNTFKDEKTKGIIIDLRDNGGGYLQSAVEILSNFIEKGKVVVTIKHKDSFLDNSEYSENEGKIFGKKIVVLINENSASASEIMAGALRDYNKAILVGEKSYGKGSVQQPFDLPDGSMLKLTIAKWYTPKDISIDHNGITPDVKVSFTKEDYENKYDRQLEVAKIILKKFIKLDNISLVVDEYKKENPENFGTGTLSGTGEMN